jgi:hypothetical protein
MLRQTIAGAVLVALLGTGCTLRPVYETGFLVPVQRWVVFDFAEPQSRLEQIVHRELSLRFGASEQPTALKLQVSASSSERVAARSKTPSTHRRGIAVGGTETRDVTVSVTAVVTLGGEEVFTATRVATAPYDSISPNSVLATGVARENAQEDAALAAAEALRLALLARFGRAGTYTGKARLPSWACLPGAAAELVVVGTRVTRGRRFVTAATQQRPLRPGMINKAHLI